MSWSCPRCESTVFPGFVMDDKMRMQAVCHACGSTDPTTTAADLNVGLAAVEATDDNANPGWGSKKQQVVAAGARAAIANGTVSVEMPRLGVGQLTKQSIRNVPIGDRVTDLIAEEARLEGEIAEARARLAGVRAERRTLVKLMPKTVIEAADRN